jgi:cytochrome c2
MTGRVSAILIVTAIVGLIVVGCAAPEHDESRQSPGNAERGRALIVEQGCASCHSIPDVPSVGDDSVAPDLHGFADRDVIAGQIPNRTEELIAWLMNPQEIEPGTLMPDLGLTQEEAEDIAAYLYQH